MHSSQDASDIVADRIRNEDFFFLRWGGSQYIRAHIARNGGPFVGGYITGSEAHIPAFDYATTPGSPSRTWEYDFERQWLYYMEWGRLLFDPNTKDAVFAAAYAKQCGLASQEEGQAMLDAMHAAAIMPLRFASFIYSKCMKCNSPLCVLVRPASPKSRTCSAQTPSTLRCTRRRSYRLQRTRCGPAFGIR